MLYNTKSTAEILAWVTEMSNNRLMRITKDVWINMMRNLLFFFSILGDRFLIFSLNSSLIFLEMLNVQLMFGTINGTCNCLEVVDYITLPISTFLTNLMIAIRQLDSLICKEAILLATFGAIRVRYIVHPDFLFIF